MGLLAVLAGLLPAPLPPAASAWPWTDAALGNVHNTVRTLIPSVLGTLLVAVASLYAARKVRPPYGALAVTTLVLLGVSATASSTHGLRAMLGAPFSGADFWPLLVLAGLTAIAAARELEKQLAPGSRGTRLLLALGGLSLVAAFVLPRDGELAIVWVGEAWVGLATAQGGHVARLFFARSVELALLATAAAALWTAGKQARLARMWAWHRLPPLAVCLLALAALMGEESPRAALAWVRNGLWLGILVDGGAWAATRLTKAVLAKKTTWTALSGPLALVLAAAGGLQVVLALPPELATRSGSPAPVKVERALRELLPKHAFGASPSAGELQAIVAPVSRALEEATAQLLAPVPAGEPGSAPARRRLEALNAALRDAGYPLLATLGPTQREGQRTVVVARWEKVIRHPTSHGPFEVLVVSIPANGVGHRESLGHVRPGAATAIVHREAIAEHAESRARSVVVDATCGFAGPSTPDQPELAKLDAECGKLVRGALPRKPAGKKWVQRLDEVTRRLELALLRTTVRHEMQHQLDADALRMPSRAPTALQVSSFADAVQVELEASAQLAELTATEPIDVAVSLLEQLAHLLSSPDNSVEHRASWLSLFRVMGLPRSSRLHPHELAAQVVQRWESGGADALRTGARDALRSLGRPIAEQVDLEEAP